MLSALKEADFSPLAKVSCLYRTKGLDIIKRAVRDLTHHLTLLRRCWTTPPTLPYPKEPLLTFSRVRFWPLMVTHCWQLLGR